MSSQTTNGRKNNTNPPIVTQQVSVSSPGKVILHGEHSVVYGKMALAVSIDLRTKVNLKVVADEQGQLRVNFPDLEVNYVFNQNELCNNIMQDKQNFSSIVTSIKAYLTKRNPNCTLDNGIVALIYLFLNSHQSQIQSQSQSVEVVVTSEIPIGAGLGSSAAFSVSLSAAFHQWAKSLSNHNQNGALDLDTSNNNHFSSNKLNLKTKVGIYFASNVAKRHKISSSNGEIHDKMEFDKADLDQICQRAFMAEKILHGNPSGKVI